MSDCAHIHQTLHTDHAFGQRPSTVWFCDDCGEQLAEVDRHDD